MEIKKVELIDWIAHLNDQQTLKMILSLKNQSEPKKKTKDPGFFGSGKKLIEFIAEDFNDPIDAFSDYQK